MAKTIRRSQSQGNTARPDEKISKADIRKRAFEIYESRDPDDGSPEDDWSQAEEELLTDPGY